jgi:FkbM family methyltransferase
MEDGEISALVRAYDDLLMLREHAGKHPNDLTAQFAKFCAAKLAHSHAQFFQDLFVAFFLRGKRNGFFVEFGAADGVTHSNTCLLEQKLQWKGILAEPARCWHSALRNNRQAAIDTHCVWSETGARLEFIETDIRGLSTLSSLADKDCHRKHRLKGVTYNVESISLNDLLRLHNCPKQIDYLSIDTEGSELPILRCFDFEQYEISLITVEHNFSDPDRTQLYDLLTAKGFVRVLEPLTKVDDWYINRRILDAHGLVAKVVKVSVNS